MENIRERINKTFEKSNSLITKRRITREADWQTWLYCDLRDEFSIDKNIRILLEGRIKKGNSSCVWFSGDKVGKLKENLDAERFIETDESGWVKISLNNLDELNSRVRNLLLTESSRRFYVDLLIQEINDNKHLAIIEMKFHKNLDQSFITEDVRKLKRVRSVINQDCLLYATGYCLAENKFISISV